MNQLEDRLTSLLARSGAAIEVRPDVDRVLAAGRRVEHELHDDRDVPTRSRRRRLLPAAALTVAVALVGAAALVLRDGRHGPGTSDPEPADIVTVGDPPDGWLMPAWVPEGMQPWTVEWHTSPGAPPTVVPQLFGDPDEGRAIFVTASFYEVRADMAREVTVRGQTGQAGPSWNVEEKDMGDAIAWDERGTTLTALYTGMSTDEAIAALDALAWRSDDPSDGFALPSGGSLPLHAEASRQPPAGRDATLVYSDGPPDGAAAGRRPGLEVHTSTGDTVPGRYLEAWYEQGPAAGGGERPLTSVDEDGHRLSVLWPDGRSIDVSAIGGAPGREVLQQVADSLTIATEADMAALRGRAEAATGALPVVASAATRIGTVEVHGDGGFLRLCLGGPAQPGPSCPVNDLGGGSSIDGAAVVTAEWTIDGTWYVVVASTGAPPQIVGGHDPSRSPDAGELPADTATSRDWTIRLVQPAPEIAQVCISTPGVISCPHHRPS
jgi:hypothetical protein